MQEHYKKKLLFLETLYLEKNILKQVKNYYKITYFKKNISKFININNYDCIYSNFSNKLDKKIINKGKINSANDKPSQVVLNARPLVFSKNLDIVVVAVWDISPWPDNLIKKIDKNKKATDEILENKKQEIASNAMT